MGADMKLAIYLTSIGTLIGGAATFGVISFMHMVLGVNPGTLSGPIGAVVTTSTMLYAYGAARLASTEAGHEHG